MTIFSDRCLCTTVIVVNWLAGVAPRPSRWPYTLYGRDQVRKLLARVKFSVPGE